MSSKSNHISFPKVTKKLKNV
uniref:Uncharacterized protein n=1 Tax=Anguilla anguilla TaxID=7936 RepID=A0A0E9PVW2_ANGAN